MTHKGFRINSISLLNAENGQQLWRSEDEGNFHSSEKEITANVPKGILQLKAFTREINFSTVERIQNLRLEQTVLFNENPEEYFEFLFGFVIPGSTNSWQQTIMVDKDSDPIPHEILSGNVVVMTKFLDGEKVVASSRVRIFYI